MLYRLLILFVLLSHIQTGYAQWNTSLGAGAAIPITGYGEVVKTGWLLEAGAGYRLNAPITLGMKVQFTRLQNDKNGDDEFEQARMTVTPLLFIADYEFGGEKLQPYAGLGLGITFFNINYDVSPTEGESINNVSFSLMPRLGLKMPTSGNWVPYLESGLVMLADGPPVGFPHGEKATGYVHISAGVQYRF